MSFFLALMEYNCSGETVASASVSSSSSRFCAILMALMVVTLMAGSPRCCLGQLKPSVSFMRRENS